MNATFDTVHPVRACWNCRKWQPQECNERGRCTVNKPIYKITAWSDGCGKWRTNEKSERSHD